MKKQGVEVALVGSASEGILFAQKELYEKVTPETLLFLSGGKTPRDLYVQLAMNKKLKPGAIALVDERYGEPFHANSNEKMLKDTGLFDYISTKNIPLFSILQPNRHSGESKTTPESRSWTSQDDTIEKTASEYEKTLEGLLQKFSKRIAIMGIGADGHTAGLPAGIKNSIRQAQDKYELRIKNKGLVDYIDDFPGEFGKRITLTFRALEQMDLFIVLVFGSAKQSALNAMFTKGSEEEIPARFFLRPEIAKRTLLITDQNV